MDEMSFIALWAMGAVAVVVRWTISTLPSAECQTVSAEQKEGDCHVPVCEVGSCDRGTRQSDRGKKVSTRRHFATRPRRIRRGPSCATFATFHADTVNLTVEA